MTKTEELAYLHPFGCEARVYGRLQELNLEHIAARCYGYLILNGRQRKALWERDYYDWEQDWGYNETHKRTPVFAIVKEFVDAEIIDENDRKPYANLRRIKATMNRESGTKLVQHLKKLHRVGILVRDINGGNIMNGLFVDFSTAWTVPHPVLTKEKMDDDDILPWMHQGLKDADELDSLIDIWNEHHDFSEKIWARLLPDDEYCKKLRYQEYPERQWCDDMDVLGSGSSVVTLPKT
ncbi:kinetochore Sim4 complex subunit FTA2-domain-containing protein [Whalleya microplaca]|nr:kinetochore Sim4 complex subunit FTA2-domain-containing protein [Whalleya microplaca]